MRLRDLNKDFSRLARANSCLRGLIRIKINVLSRHIANVVVKIEKTGAAAFGRAMIATPRFLELTTGSQKCRARELR